MLPYGLRLPALLLALAAAWGASQTVVNGSFTIVSEAIRLNLLPALEIRYPSDSIRQEYIPAVNFLMWLFTCLAAVFFRSGQGLASVYGFTIAIAMLTTSILLFVFSRSERPGAWPVHGLIFLIGMLEVCFLIAGLEKLPDGGMATLVLTLLMTAAMLSWNRAEEIEVKFGARLPLRGYLSQLEELRSDTDFGKLADNLVYIDSVQNMETVDQAILYSVLDRGPKRAKAYWFVTVSTVSEPNLQRYRVETFGTDCVFRLQLDLVYKCSRPLTWYLKAVFLDMERQGLAPISRKEYCLSEASALGTFRYIVLRRRISGAESFTVPELWALRVRELLLFCAGMREEWYTEENTDVNVEWIPLSLAEDGVSATAAPARAGWESASVSIPGHLEKARDPSATPAAARKAFSKLGGTRWAFSGISVEDPLGLFAPPALLNDARRRLVAALDSALEESRAARISAALTPSHGIVPSHGIAPKNNLDLPPSRGVVLKLRLDQPLPPSIADFSEHEADFNALRSAVKHLMRAGFAKWEASDLAALRLLRALGATDITADWPLYSFNRAARALLAEMGVARTVVSPEMSAAAIAPLNVTTGAPPVEFLVRQSTPLFISLTRPAAEDPSCLTGLNGDSFTCYFSDGLWITIRAEPRKFPRPSGDGVILRTDLSWDAPSA